MSNVIKILNGLEEIYQDNFIIHLKRTLEKNPEVEDAMSDALSIGQIKSKEWLIDHLPKELGKVFICAGWYGTLAAMMFRANLNITEIRTFDVDPSCAVIAENMNRTEVQQEWKFKASTLDILDMTYPTKYVTYRANGTSVLLEEMPDTIINTSCEHIKYFQEWYDHIPTGTTLVLQSNNYFEHNQHINCVPCLKEFKKRAPMSEIFYAGELFLPKYTRFMLIGKK